MIAELFNEFVKNTKIMFRNWTSLSLLVIVPIVMILLIGYAFSGDDLRDIEIGVVTDGKADMDAFSSNISSYGTIREFESMDECMSYLSLRQTHICLELEGELTSELIGMESAKLRYVYDNTRKKISLPLIQSIQDFFGLESEQISVESAQTIIEEIQHLVFFLNERKEDIKVVEAESSSIKRDLIERKVDLIETQKSFMEPYMTIKELQKTMHSYAVYFNSASSGLDEAAQGVFDALDTVKLITFPFENITLAAEDLEQRIQGFTQITNATAQEVNEFVAAVDEIVIKMDQINVTLEEEIQRNDEYVAKIDESVGLIENASTQLDEKLSELEQLDPSMAQTLVKPIMSEYQELLGGIKNIQISFPQLAVIIIMFISLLFANISGLMEIHNRAYLRSLISPVNDMVYTVGMWLTSIVIIFFQILVLFIVAQTMFDISISGIFFELSLIAILLIMFFVLLGMIFAYLFDSVQSSILMTTFVSLILFIFGNTLAPIEMMPKLAGYVSKVNPIVLGEYLITQIQLFGTSLSMLYPELILLVSYIVVLFVVLIVLSKIKNRKRN